MTPKTVSGTRLTSLLKRWKEIAAGGDAVAEKCKALFCVIGELSPSTLGNQRGQAVAQYLAESSESPSNIAIVMTESSTVVIVADKTTVVPPADPVVGALQDHPHSVTVVSIAEAADAVRSLLSSGAAVGAALRELEIQEGAFAADMIKCVRQLAGAPGQLVDAAPVLGELLFTKDAAALGCVEKAARLCSAIFRRYARQAVEEQIQATSPKTLLQIREELCEKLEKPNTVHGLEGVNAAEFGMATGLTPCVFHRGTYVPQIQVDAAQLEQAAGNVPLRGDVVTVRFGTKNGGYTAFFARTLLVKSKAPHGAREAYEFMYQVSEKVISLLVPGSKLRDVHAAAMEYAKGENSELAEHLPKSFGFSTGLLVLESRGTISEKGSATVAESMTFVVRVSLEGLPDGEGGATYAMELGDTVIIRGGVAELQTKVTRKTDDITFEDGDASDADSKGEAEGGAFEVQRHRDLAKITRQGQSGTVILSREAQRDEELKVLLRKLHSEFLAAGGKKGTQIPTEELRVFEVGRLSFGEVNPFSSADRLPPPETQDGRIFVQPDKKVAWFPLFGSATPFHISTISKVDTRVEGERYTLSVVFHTLQEANVSYKLNRDKVFLKELNYSADRDVFTDVREQIQAVQLRIKNDDANRKRNATTATTGKLVVGKIVALPDVKLRPPVSVGRQNKGCVGNLELHQNGLRFTFLGGPPIDILFDNIKHTIFQPSIQEMSVIYHVTLKKAIEINRKAVTEVQFIADVMESSELASGVRRSHEEEVAAEMRDETRARQTNKQFFTFAEVVEKKSSIKTQLPTKNFSFDGVHTRSMVKFRGSKEVLWAVSDWPAFTLAVEEVEVVSLERVIPGGSTFDVSFVMKDYNKPVVTLNSIPKQFLEVLKDWCLAAGLYYMETTVNPNWKVTLKDIRDDPEWDPWLPGAGWSVLNDGGDDEEDEEGDSDSESDSTYYEEEDEEDTDSDDSSWLEDEESDVDSEEDDSDASSVVSWDELDRRAEAQDRKRSYSDDDADDRPRKKARAAVPPSSARGGRGAGGPPPPPPSRPGSAAIGKTAVPPPRRF